MCRRLLCKQVAYCVHCTLHIYVHLNSLFGVILIIALFWPAGVTRQFLKSPEIPLLDKQSVKTEVIRAEMQWNARKKIKNEPLHEFPQRRPSDRSFSANTGQTVQLIDNSRKKLSQTVKMTQVLVLQITPRGKEENFKIAPNHVLAWSDLNPFSLSCLH